MNNNKKKQTASPQGTCPVIIMSGNFVRLEVSRLCTPPPPVESIANDAAYLGLEVRLA